MKKIIVCLLVIFATFISFSREAKKTGIRSVSVVIDKSLTDQTEIPYSFQPLSWEDFTAAPDSTSQWGAVTHSGIRLSYHYSEKKDSMRAEVMLLPFMDREKSWCKPAAMNNYTLEHEQRHFDITALVTHELAEEIKKTNFYLLDFPATIMKLHSKYIEKLKEMQETYDNATAHGDHFQAQLEWNEKIKARLNEIKNPAEV